MKPSDKKRKLILSYLSDQPSMTNEIILSLTGLAEKQGYSESEIYEEIQSMDLKHEKLIYIDFPIDVNGNHLSITVASPKCLTSKGEDYLDNLINAWKQKFWLMFQIYVWPIITATISGLLVWYLSHK